MTARQDDRARKRLTIVVDNQKFNTNDWRDAESQTRADMFHRAIEPVAISDGERRHLLRGGSLGEQLWSRHSVV